MKSQSEQQNKTPEAPHSPISSHQERIFQNSKKIVELFRSGRLRELENFLIDEIQYAKSQNDIVYETDLQFRLASIYIRLGEWEAAELLLTLGIEKTKHFSDQTSYGKYIATLGDLRRVQGDMATAFELLQKALGIFQDLGNHQLESVTLGNIACILIETDRKADAEPFLCQAIEISQRIGDVPNEINHSINYSKVLISEGKHHAAEKLLLKCIDLASKNNDHNLLGIAYGNLAMLFSRSERWKKSKEYYDKAIVSLKKGSNVRMLCTTMGSYGFYEWIHGDLEHAKELALETINLSKKISDPRSEAYIHKLFFSIFVDENNYQAALEELNLAIELAHHSQVPILQSMLYLQRGLFYYDLGQKEEAAADIEKGITIFRNNEMDDKHLILNDYLIYLTLEQRWEEASQVYQELVKLHNQKPYYAEEVEIVASEFFYLCEQMLNHEGIEVVTQSLATINPSASVDEHIILPSKKQSLADLYRLAISLVEEYGLQSYYTPVTILLKQREKFISLGVPENLLPLPKTWKKKRA